jgi:cathepsin A (carboxypeptidase C)
LQIRRVNFLAFDWLTDLSPYDIRKKSNYYDKNDKLIEKFLNQRQIQEKLGVSRKLAGCSDKVFDDFDHFGDESRNVVKDIPLILHAGVRVLVYAGDADFICNWIGNKAWTDSLDWSGSKGYQNAPSVPWMSGGKQAGELKSFENLTFLRIFEAGHFVPFDQPEVSLDFFNSWINGELDALSKDKY